MQYEDVVASVQKYWADGFPVALATVYPGLKVDTESLDEWAELWVDLWQERRHRRSGSYLTDLLVTAHLFVDNQLDKGRIHALCQSARDTLAQAQIPVRNYSTGGSVVVGYVTLHEPESREMSRLEAAPLVPTLQHMVVTCRGLGQAT